MPAPGEVRPLQRLLLIAALAATYFVTARLGLGLAAVSGFATLVWPPTGISIAALLLCGRRLWPGVALGALVANLAAGAPALSAAGIAAGNTLEALLAATALRRLGFDESLARLRDVALFVGAAVAAPVVAAGVGVFSLWAGGALPPSAGTSTFLAWWVGDALGALIVAPALLVWTRSRPLPVARTIEAAILLAALVGLSLVIFLDLISVDPAGLLRQAYLLFPLFIWAVLRFRQLGAVTSVLAVAILAIAGTTWGHGPFAGPSLLDGLLLLGTFLGFVTVGVLFFGAAVAELDRSHRLTHEARLEAEQAVADREEFMAIAAHELRTPLTSLKLQVHAMVRSRSEPAGGIDVLVRQVERLAGLVDNLLDVSRAVSGRLDLQPEEVDLRSVIDDVVARCKEQLGKAGCAVSVEGDATCTGTWDPVRLEQILINLLGNAMKYGAGAPIAIQLHGTGATAVVTVRDRGIGVRAEDRLRIFERFTRAAAPAGSGGLGLGLWIVSQIVAAMGGSVAVDSEPGDGATFRLVLPRTTPTPAT